MERKYTLSGLYRSCYGSGLGCAMQERGSGIEGLGLGLGS